MCLRFSYTLRSSDNSAYLKYIMREWSFNDICFNHHDLIITTLPYPPCMVKDFGKFGVKNFLKKHVHSVS